MKKAAWILVALVVMLLCSIACAEEINYDKVYSNSEYCYTLLEDDSVEILRYIGSQNTGTLRVPSEIEGKTVTVIGEYAFCKPSYLLAYDEYVYFERIILPDTIKKIKDYAFYYLSDLKEIEIPEGVEEIGSFLFQDCGFLEKVSLPSTLQSIGINPFCTYYQSG